MSEEVAHKVKLHAYDLSRGMARAMSQQLLGIQLDGICLGETYLPKEVFEDWLNEVSPQYTIETYDIFKFNCNNFSEAACQFLTGGSIPDEIKNLPQNVLNTPLGQMLRPIIEGYQNLVKGDIANEFGNQFHWQPQQPIQQSATPVGVSNSTNSPNTPTSPSSTTAPSSPLPTSTSTKQTHILKPADRRPLLAEIKHEDATAFVSKIVGLASLKDKLTPENISAIETLAAHMSKNPKIAPKEALSVAHVGALVDALKQCSPADGFHLLYILAPAVLTPIGQTYFLGDVNFVDSVIRKFMGKDANKNAKVMAFFTASNLFASAECSRVMLARRSRSMLIDHIVESINSTKKDLRLAASGLVLNYCQFLPLVAKDDDATDDMTQILTAIIELFLRIEKEFNDAANAEFGSRLTLSLGYLISNNDQMKELAVTLGISEILQNLMKLPASGPTAKLAAISSEVSALLNK